MDNPDVMGFSRKICILLLGLTSCLGSAPVNPESDRIGRAAPLVSPAGGSLSSYEPSTPALRQAIQMAEASEAEAKRALAPASKACSVDPGVQPSASGALIDQIIDEAQKDYGCKVIEVSRGGRLKDMSVVDRGYGRLIGRSYARQLCSQPPRPAASEVLRMAAGATGGGRQKDALSHFAGTLPFPGDSEMDAADAAMANTYSILYSLGRAESNGFADEGEDMSASRGRPSSAIEAGMFQVSYDVLGSDPRFEGLKQYWTGSVASLRTLAASGGVEALATSCGIDSSPGSELRWHRKPGTRAAETLYAQFSDQGACTQSSFDAALCFRSMHQYCPQFTVDFNLVGIRLNRPHWGPLNRFAIQPSCSAIFKKLHAREAEICAQPWADPARNDD